MSGKVKDKIATFLVILMLACGLIWLIVLMSLLVNDLTKVEKPDSKISAEDIVRLEREQFGISADLNNLEKMLIDLEKLKKEVLEKLEEEKETSPK